MVDGWAGAAIYLYRGGPELSIWGPGDLILSIWRRPPLPPLSILSYLGSHIDLYRGGGVERSEYGPYSDLISYILSIWL